MIFGHEPGASQYKVFEQKIPSFLKVVESDKVMKFFDEILGGPTLTYDHKWLRSVSKGVYTGFHYDIVYMGLGTPNVYSMWTPFCDVPLEKGPLLVCEGSSKFQKLLDTYAKIDVDRDNIGREVEGHISKDPLEILEKFGGRWCTTNFRAGDVMIFGMYFLHGSCSNISDFYRISCDTRYQLKSEPVDDRWVGDVIKGHYNWGKLGATTMKTMRDKWGI